MELTLGCVLCLSSQEMEGTNYNGRQSYQRKLFDEAQMEEKKKELQTLKNRFEASVVRLRLAEARRAHVLQRRLPRWISQQDQSRSGSTGRE